MLRFCCLGSGSDGNAWVVEARDGLFATRVLVDNGFNPTQLGRRLAAIGLAIDDIDALILTHEHDDHSGGAEALLRRRPVPLLATAGTVKACALSGYRHWRRLSPGRVLDLGALQLAPFAVPHDAEEPVQFVFTDGARRLGMLTDIGAPNETVARALDGLDALVLECNHDAALLAAGSYPPFLKSRIAGAYGHLSNAQAAELLACLDVRRLNCVVAAHLSRQNNRAELAQQALADALSCHAEEIFVADQYRGLDWRAI